MSRPARPLVRPLALTAVLALGLAACSSSPSQDASPDVSASPTPSATSEAEPTTDAVDDEVPGDQQAALDMIVEQSQASIPTIHEAFPGMYSEIAITPDGPSTLVYSYVYEAEAVEGASAADVQAGMGEVSEMLQTACDSQLFPAMESAGVTQDPRVRYEYAMPSGEEVFSYTCEPSA